MSESIENGFYRVRHDQIVQEDVDGEVIVIDMKSGNYYSLRDTAVDIWKLLLEGGDVATLSQVLRQTYTGNESEVTNAVKRLVAELVREDLVEAIAPAAVPDPAAGSTGKPVAAFAPPLFEVYTDVQDLLLLDPIHDVTESGWPENPAQSKAHGDV